MADVISIIPARSGSLGVKEKNLQTVNGKTLVEIAVNASKSCPLVKETFVSSDTKKILDLAEQNGAKTHERSEKNSSSVASMRDTLKEFDAFYKGTGQIKNTLYLVLYPTYPFRTDKDLVNIITYYKSHGHLFEDGLIGVKPVSEHPYLTIKCDDKRIEPAYNPNVDLFYRRQDYPDLSVICHWACIIPSTSLNSINNQLFSEKTLPYELDKSPIDIDSYEDLNYANFLASQD